MILDGFELQEILSLFNVSYAVTRAIASPVLPLSLTYRFCLVLTVPLGKGEEGLSLRRWACPDSTIARGMSVDNFGLRIRMADIVLDFPLLLSASCCVE